MLVVLYVTSALFAAWFGFGIDIKTDLKDLLPKDASSVQALEEARERRGSNDYYVIAVESPEPSANIAFVEALAEEIETWEEVNNVTVERDRSFLRENALLFLPVSDLQRIRSTLQRMIRRELGQSNPLFIDLERDREEEELNWRDPDNWIDPLTLREMGLSDDSLEEMFPFLAEPDAPPEPATNEQEKVEPEPTVSEDYQDYLISPNGTVVALLARVEGSSTDVDFAKRMYERGETLIASLDPENFHPELHAEVVGSYRGFLEVRSIIEDVGTATIISVVLVLLLLFIYFRSLRSVIIVLLPLAIGMAWTLGLLNFLFGYLNTLTAFVFAMLIGMGIDFGIHLYGRALEEFNHGETWEKGLTRAITHTGAALVTATATTVVSLLTLTLASFNGFVEFGLACAIGIAISLFATMLVVPVLVGASEKVNPLKRIKLPHRTSAVLGRNAAIMQMTAMAVFFVSVFGLLSIGDAKFETNFKNLQGSGTGQTIRYGAAVGSGGTTPLVLLGDSEAQMRDVHAFLRNELRNGNSRITRFITIETFLPADQNDRLEVIDDIYEILDRRAVRRLDGEIGQALEGLRALTDVEEFGMEDLPDWALESLTERDGTIGEMGLFYGKVDNENALDVQAFQQEFETIHLDDAEIPVASSAFIVADVLRYVQADGLRLALYVTLGLTFVLLLGLRSIRGVLVSLFTMVAAVLMTVVVMVLYDFKLGLYNMVVLPTVLGVGIDGAIHIFHRYLEEGADKMWHVMKTTGVAVAASSITTAAGFMGLLMVDHQGVVTIGQLAVTGVLGSLVAVLGLMPGMLTVIGKRKGKHS